MTMTAEDYARIRREAEAALKEAEKEGSPVSFDRPHADNKQNRFCCSGKKERAMRKEKMREYQEIDRQGNLESKERSAAGLGDGDLMGDFKSVTAHRAKPTSEYNTAGADRTPTIKVFK